MGVTVSEHRYCPNSREWTAETLRHLAADFAATEEGQCNIVVNGRCDTLRCLVRGGDVRGRNAVRNPTCIASEIAAALEAFAQSRETQGWQDWLESMKRDDANPDDQLAVQFQSGHNHCLAQLKRLTPPEASTSSAPGPTPPAVKRWNLPTIKDAVRVLAEFGGDLETILDACAKVADPETAAPPPTEAGPADVWCANCRDYKRAVPKEPVMCCPTCGASGTRLHWDDRRAASPAATAPEREDN